MKKQFQASIFYKYRGLFLKYKTSFLFGIIALLVTNAAAAMIPDLIRQAIDLLKLTQEHPEKPLNDLATLQTLEGLLFQMVGLAVVVFLARLLSRYWISGTGQRLEYDLRDKLYHHMLKMPASFYSANASGELMSRMTNDVEALRMMIGGGIMLGFNTLFVYCTIVPMMLKISPLLTLLAFVLYPAGIYLLAKLSGQVKQLYYGVQEILGQISATVQENFTGIAVIQSYVKEDVENQRMKQASHRYLSAYQRLIKKRVWLMMIFIILGGFSYLAVLSFGGFQVIEGSMTLGGFVAFIFYLERITWPTASMGWTISSIQQGSAALMRVDDILSQASTITSPAHPTQLPEPVQGNLRIEKLTFSYQNHYSAPTPRYLESTASKNTPVSQTASGLSHTITVTRPVLNDISILIPAGNIVALVGPIGSGKSTLLRLLPRLIETPGQTIFLDGVDITEINLETLRQHIVMMSQQSYLFSDSVGHNILFQNPDELMQLKDSHLIPVAQAAGIHPEIQAMNYQYETLVGERGLMLSGGQRQRVSLARTLLQSQLMNAPVLVLDDPFSQVDAGTEEQIIEALEARHLLERKTTLFATHRMSLVQKADWVILMNHGSVVATGRHQDLLDSQPLYRQLHQQDLIRQQSGDAVPLQDDIETDLPV